MPLLYEICFWYLEKLEVVVYHINDDFQSLMDDFLRVFFLQAQILVSEIFWKLREFQRIRTITITFKICNLD